MELVALDEKIKGLLAPKLLDALTRGTLEAPILGNRSEQDTSDLLRQILNHSGNPTVQTSLEQPRARSQDKAAVTSKDAPENRRRWTAEEDELLKGAVQQHGDSCWKTVAQVVKTRDNVQCLQRWRKSLKPGLIKGPWREEEDNALRQAVSEKDQDPSQTWSHVAAKIPGRNPKQCRERWQNFLDKSIRRGAWTEAEDKSLLRLHSSYNGSWSAISKLLPGRTENSVKVRFISLQRRERKEHRLSNKAGPARIVQNDPTISPSDPSSGQTSPYTGALPIHAPSFDGSISRTQTPAASTLVSRLQPTINPKPKSTLRVQVVADGHRKRPNEASFYEEFRSQNGMLGQHAYNNNNQPCSESEALSGVAIHKEPQPLDASRIADLPSAFTPHPHDPQSLSGAGSSLHALFSLDHGGLPRKALKVTSYSSEPASFLSYPRESLFEPVRRHSADIINAYPNESSDRLHLHLLSQVERH